MTIMTGLPLGMLVTLSSVGGGCAASDLWHAGPLPLLTGAGDVLLGGTDRAWLPPR